MHGLHTGQADLAATTDLHPGEAKEGGFRRGLGGGLGWRGLEQVGEGGGEAGIGLIEVIVRGQVCLWCHIQEGGDAKKCLQKAN